MRRSLLSAFVFCLALGAAAAAAGQTPRKYALLIGLNRYGYPTVGIATLEFAKADVQALQAVLEQQGYEVTPLWDNLATREGVMIELSRYAAIVTEADDFLIYYAGHGVRNKSVNRKTYWLTYDARLEALDVSGIRLRHLLDYVADIPARRKLILLDHCFSGDVISSPQRPPEPSRGTAGGDPISRGPGDMDVHLERGAFPVADLTASITFAGEGVILIAASRGAAYEMRDKHHGLFTSAILEALNSRAADTDNDGRLSVAELNVYLTKRVHELSNGTQDTLNMQTANNTNAWYVTDRLPVVDPAEATTKAAIYKRTLSEWEQKHWIKTETKNRSWEVLQSWPDSLGAGGRRLREGDQRLLDKIREAVDSVAPERTRAEVLETFLQLALEGGNR